jgi:hypothetical protein
MTIGTRINKFENSAKQTVEEFNKLFKENKLDGFSNDMEVEIGDMIGPNERLVTVGGVEMKHDFNPGLGELGESFMNIGDITTNRELENEVMTEKEMELEPLEYMILQYLRGARSQFHTQIEIAGKLNKSVRRVRDIMHSLEERKIIEVKNITNIQRLKITVAEAWA